MYKKEFSDYFDKNMPQILESLNEIISVESVSTLDSDVKPFGEGSKKALEWGENFLKGLGMKTENIDGYAVHGDFYADKKPELAVLSHLDTVPAGEGWHYPPFALTEDNGVLYGRGTIDDKGPSVAVLYAVKAIRDLKIPISKNFRIIFGGFEEGGCEDMEYYETKHSFPDMVFTPDGSFPVLNCEKGLCHITFKGKAENGVKAVNSFKAGTVINAVPGKCECEVSGVKSDEIRKAFDKLSDKFSIEFTDTENGVKLVCTGKSAHGSRPENGLNTATALLHIFKTLGIKCFGSLDKIFPHNDYSGKAVGLGFEDKVSGVMTCVLTQLECHNGIVTGGIDIRFPIDRTSSEICGIVEKALTSADMEITDCDTMEPHYVDKDSRLVKTLLKVYENVSGKKGECISEGGVTYVHNTKGGVAFGAEFPEENNNMHGADEHISMDTFKINLNMYANAIYEICR